jgi:acyl-CoA dehydrogenase
MSETLTSMVGRMLADHCDDAVALRAEDGAWPDALWQVVEDVGLTLALIEAGEHSPGLGVDEAFQIVRRLGGFAAPVPLPETMLANWLLARSGLEPRPGPLVVVADAALRADESGSRLHGEVPAVPWGRRAGVVGCFERAGALHVAYFGREGFAVHEGANIAREPRDRLVFDADMKRIEAVPLPAGLDGLRLRAAGAALRCSQIAGALEKITTMTIDYAGQRVQFGRPISKFQAVQQNLAVLAAQTALSSSAADMAADAFADGIRLAPIAAAKTSAGEAAGVCAGIAHQVHGAMGFSREYTLHLRTKRLWSWRDEYGNEAEWSRLLGDGLVRQGADQLWAGITGIQ